MTTGINRSRATHWIFAIAVGLVAMALYARPASAQRRYLGMGHTLRLEGIVEPAAGTDIIGEIHIRAGDSLRRFGVTSAIAPGEDGMAIFRNQKLRRETFKLVGGNDVLRPFNDAAPGTKLNLVGVLQPDSLLVAWIDVLAPTPDAAH